MALVPIVSQTEYFIMYTYNYYALFRKKKYGTAIH